MPASGPQSRVKRMAVGKPLYRRKKQLYAFGYIIYKPSFNPVIKKMVVLVRVSAVY
jgi:hypothetical protein